MFIDSQQDNVVVFYLDFFLRKVLEISVHCFQEAECPLQLVRVADQQIGQLGRARHRKHHGSAGKAVNNLCLLGRPWTILNIR
jgi:hypothetical protein